MTLAIIAVTAALAGSAAADPPVGGFLPVAQAISFQKQYFPPVAPKLLRDRRATFFHTKRPISVGDCHRRSRPTVVCHFSLKLIPDRAHRRRNWWPIRCTGQVRTRHRTDGSLVGDVRGYTCHTVRP